MKAEERVIQLEGENAELRKQLAEALARIEELERQQKKDSHTSHKPPSSDGLRRKTHSLRKPSGRKSGGQGGHAGQTLEMKADPDEISRHRPQTCQQCGESLQARRGRVVERGPRP